MASSILNSIAEHKFFITGHTGFKGSWLCKILDYFGAEIHGYALEPSTNPNLFETCSFSDNLASTIGDIRDRNLLINTVKEFQPDIVIHMAAQPLVRESYKDPFTTYETNVMGTVNILDAVRSVESVKSFLNVTTDKVYKNNDWVWGYRENDALGGLDPYSNSKSCSELVTESYLYSFFQNSPIAISTARAGNVIGGGDFSKDRIIPDCVKSVINNEDLIIRNPNSIRPYQHVLDPLFAYLKICLLQLEDNSFAGSYNIGPDEQDCVTTSDLVRLFSKHWGDSFTWKIQSDNGPREANTLKLDCMKAKTILNWSPVWDIEKAIQNTVIWTKEWMNGINVSTVMDDQIKSFISDFAI